MNNNIENLLQKEVYNINEVANMFEVGNETVRRWIRDHSLNAEIKSRRRGYLIRKEDIISFRIKRKKVWRAYKFDNNSMKESLDELLVKCINKRKFIGVSLERMANILDISKQTLYNWEAGTVEIPKLFLHEYYWHMFGVHIGEKSAYGDVNVDDDIIEYWLNSQQ